MACDINVFGCGHFVKLLVLRASGLAPQKDLVCRAAQEYRETKRVVVSSAGPLDS